MTIQLLAIAGPTASGKSSRAVEEALTRNGEIISVDSRQVYRGLDIGTEKVTASEMRGVPHHLLDIREPEETYSAGEFVADATTAINDIVARGKLPILVGGSHFYFDALLQGLPDSADPDPTLRAELERLSDEELCARVRAADPRRAAELDPKNRRRLIRALEIITARGSVPERRSLSCTTVEDNEHRRPFQAEWIEINPDRDELRARIDARLKSAFERGLIDEVRRVRERVGDARINELGLEYRVVGEFLRDERSEASLLPALSAKLWQYARRQKAWLRKLRDENVIAGAPSHPDRS